MFKRIVLTIVIFLTIDFFWLLVIAKNFYDQQLGSFQRTINWLAALPVYLLIPLGIGFFVLPKSNNQALLALGWGAVYGLIVYGVYDLTNLATLKNWSLTMVIVDILWGMFICSLTSWLVFYLTHTKYFV